MYYVVKYSGAFGFIKPWTAVRDGETYSQQFLTPSIVEGMRQKLGVSAIVRHKLTYSSISIQQERTQSKAWEEKRQTRTKTRVLSVLKRGVMVSPILYLAFDNFDDAACAMEQHICLCRNEDILLPDPPDDKLLPMKKEKFDQLDGFELRFGKGEKSFLVGFNRFEGIEPMFGHIEISGNPVGGDCR
jgi:hypothetical protein